jgi:hypothetical protein
MMCVNALKVGEPFDREIWQRRAKPEVFFGKV